MSGLCVGLHRPMGRNLTLRDDGALQYARSRAEDPRLCTAMTLIISLITNDFVCQVSDRRLTDLNTRQQINSKASKTVVVPPARLMVSYTGLAHVAPTMTTDEWLMRTLFEVRESDDYFGAIAVAASDAFRRIRLPATCKRHGFVLVGWLPDDLGAGPFCCFISNFLDFDAGRELTETRDEFNHLARPLLPGERFLIFTAGASLTAPESSSLEADVASALRSSAGKERAASVCLLRMIQTVSERDDTVGGGAFVSAISREYVAGSAPEPDSPGLHVMGMRWGLPERGVATFAHVPDEPTEVIESPAIVGDPFAGKMRLRIVRGEVPSPAGVGEVPEEGSAEFRLIALRGSDEIAAAVARDDQATGESFVPLTNSRDQERGTESGTYTSGCSRI